MTKENVIVEKSFAFSIRIVNLCKYLVETQKEYVISKQLLRSGTSIGANISEAQRGYSRADFAAKIGIALKEANETEYWLKLLHATTYLNDEQYASINADMQEIINILVRISTTLSQTKK